MSALFFSFYVYADAAELEDTGATEPQKQLLWGDTHLHTSYSFDAFLNGNMSADPNVAYRFAKGLPVIHPYNRTRVQIGTPLDFLVVSDHAEFYGGLRDLYLDGVQDPDPNVLESLAYWWTERQIRNAIDAGTGPEFFADLLPQDEDPRVVASQWIESNAQNSVPGADISAKNAWSRMLEMAENHHQPGEFTTLIGWEWTTNPGGSNLHRIVVTDASPAQAKGFMPFSSVDSPFPEDLWQWMAETEDKVGARFFSIPHNSNISKGIMFADESLRGETIDAAYATVRTAREPIVEVTQIKGDSETHPSLSPNDRFADFETYPWYIQQTETVKYVAAPGDYARSALKAGLAYQADLGVNPFQFGMIGSTDSHTGLSSAEEPNFWGKMAYDSVPERKEGAALAIGPTGWSMQAGGLAAVWATENSRTAIIDAFERREVYATTGPRIVLNFRANVGDIVTPMGSTLTAPASPPKFIVSAQRDPNSASLDRVQIVKGWLDSSGQTQEQVYNVAWSGDTRTLADDGSLPPVPDTVNRATAEYDAEIGANELHAQWEDPTYNAAEHAFYYVRVLEVPTPRHSLLDALALRKQSVNNTLAVIQERAYSSPIWVIP